MHISSAWPWLEPGDSFPHLYCNGDKWPRISIVTPNYNYGHLIEMTMRSVLFQGYPNLEYIVIDDGSTDNSLEVIDRYAKQLSYCEHQPNQGQYPTINKGFSKATGDILAWLNSDDIYLPWTLHTVGMIFAEFPQIDWIAGCFSAIQDGIVHSVHPFRSFPRSMIRSGAFYEGSGGYGYIQQESCFWRRSLWQQSSGLRQDLRYAADFALWPCFAEYAELYAVSTLLGGFTSRQNQNRSRANRQQYKDEVLHTISTLRRDPHSNEAKLARRLARYERCQHTLGHGIAAKLFSVRELCGATLEWDFGEGRYIAGCRSLF